MPQDIYVPGYIIAGATFLFLTAGLVVWRLFRRRQRFLSQLQRDMAEMEMAYANAPIGLAMLSRDLRYIKINKLLAQINGLRVEEHYGKTIYEAVPEVAKAAGEQFLQVIRTGKPLLGVVFEGTTTAQPGEQRSWRENVYPIFADDGQVIGINVAVEDITEEKRLHDALKASELRERERATELETVMNATPAAIFISRDVSCADVTANAEGNRVLRLAPGQNASANPPNALSTRPFTEYATGALVDANRLPMQVAAATGKEVRGVELSCHFENGDVVHVLANAAPLIHPTGDVVGVVGALIDVTAQKQAEQLLMRDSQRKDEFLATLAHELRNPLAAIQNSLELLRLAPAASPTLANVRDIVARQLSHLVRLIDDLMDVSRISSGKLELRKEKLMLGAIIDNALEVSRMHIEAAGHAFDVRVPREPLYVEADPLRMAQVVTNLLSNAAKYTPEGGHIVLSVAQENGNAVIRVTDNGIGIAEEMLSKIFDMFVQVENARDRRKGGLGIGLSFARQVVEMHGGTLTGESAGAGRGSTFTVRLPLSAAPVDDRAPHGHCTKMPASSKDRRILIVDDNVDAAQTLGALLELSGHTIQLAHSGKDAMEIVRKFHPEIAFVDIGLPDMSGLDVAKTLRSEEPGLMLVALTGWGSPKDRLDCKQAGFDFHLTKPVTIDAIKRILPGLKMPSHS